MSFKARLNVDGMENPTDKDGVTGFRVLNCSYNLDRDTDFTGRPTGDVRGGIIRVELESSSNNEFFEWVISTFKQMNGKLDFYKRDENAIMRSLEFSDAYCVNYAEMFSAVGDSPMTMSVTISAKKIKMNAGEHMNDWPS